MSQRALGRGLQQPHGYVAKCESGERRLNVIELRAWCAALGVDWTKFVLELEEQLQRESYPLLELEEGIPVQRPRSK